MKIAIVSSHAGGDIDPTVAANLLSHLPNQVANVNEADVIIIPVSFQPNYVFNPKLHEVENKKRIILDFIECGWNAGDKNNIFGTGMTQQFGHLNTVDYAKFDQWVAANPPALTLKRELLVRDASRTMRPVEWPCATPALRLQTKEEFDARPLELFFAWGLSSPSRPRLHGKIFSLSHDYGIRVVDNWSDDARFEGRTWATIFCPHWRRKHWNELLRWQRRSKLSVSLWGAGKKCLRSSMESPVASIMALPTDDLWWSFPWTSENSVLLRDGFEFEDLEAATKFGDLYERYVAGQENIDRYRSTRYVNDYVLPAIVSVL